MEQGRKGPSGPPASPGPAQHSLLPSDAFPAVSQPQSQSRSGCWKFGSCFYFGLESRVLLNWLLFFLGLRSQEVPKGCCGSRDGLLSDFSVPLHLRAQLGVSDIRLRHSQAAPCLQITFPCSSPCTQANIPARGSSKRGEQ